MLLSVPARRPWGQGVRPAKGAGPPMPGPLGTPTGERTVNGHDGCYVSAAKLRTHSAMYCV